MTEATRLLGQFDISQAPRLRKLATTLQQRAAAGAQAPALRQAKVVSSNGGSPPTCTVKFDDGGVGADIRYLKSYTPAVNDIVEVLIRPGGNSFIFGVLA
jgi:hypothetical protein